MKTTIIAIGFLIVTMAPALAQEQGPLTVEALKAQVRELEATSTQHRSLSLQRIHQRALREAYRQLQIALTQDIAEAKKIRASVASGEVAAEIDRDLRVLILEERGVSQKLSALNDRSFPGSDDVPTEVTDGAPSRSEPATRSNTASSGTGTERNIQPGGNLVTPPSSSRDFTVPSLSAVVTGPVVPPDAQRSTSLNADLNNLVKEATRAKIQQRSASNQTETPTVSNNSTSLVDTSSAGDLVNLGLNLAGLTGSSKNGATPPPNSLSVTTSAYALFSAFQGVDPLNPGFYNRNSGWRRLSFTFGYDDAENAGAGLQNATKIFGAKYLIIDKRDPSRSRHQANYDLIANNLKTASTAFGRLDDKVKYYFFTNKTVREKLLLPQFRVFLQTRKASAIVNPQAADPNEEARIDSLLQRLDKGQVFVVDANGVAPSGPLADARIVDVTPSGSWKSEELRFFTQFANDYLSADYRNKLKDAVGQKVLDELDAFIDKQLTDTKAYEDLSDSTREALEEIRRAPQFSFYFLTKQRPNDGDDDYTGEAIFDYGVADRINLTLNGNYQYKNSRFIGADTRSAKVSGQFRFQLTPERLAGRNPFFFFLSGDAGRHSGSKSTYHLQAKVNIPIFNGFDLPFSLTYGNQPDLNKEKTIRGQFGFTFDIARIMQALTPR